MYLKISNRYFVSNQKITVSLDLDHLKEPDSISFFLTSNSNIYILESLLCSACHSSSRFNASRINIPHTGTLFHSCFFAIQVGFLLTCSYYKHSLYCFFSQKGIFPIQIVFQSTVIPLNFDLCRGAISIKPPQLKYQKISKFSSNVSPHYSKLNIKKTKLIRIEYTFI